LQPGNVWIDATLVGVPNDSAKVVASTSGGLPTPPPEVADITFNADDDLSGSVPAFLPALRSTSATPQRTESVPPRIPPPPPPPPRPDTAGTQASATPHPSEFTVLKGPDSAATPPATAATPDALVDAMAPSAVGWANADEGLGVASLSATAPLLTEQASVELSRDYGNSEDLTNPERRESTE